MLKFLSKIPVSKCSIVCIISRKGEKKKMKRCIFFLLKNSYILSVSNLVRKKKFHVSARMRKDTGLIFSCFQLPKEKRFFLNIYSLTMGSHRSSLLHVYKSVHHHATRSNNNACHMTHVMMMLQYIYFLERRIWTHSIQFSSRVIALPLCSVTRGEKKKVEQTRNPRDIATSSWSGK